MPGDPNAVAQAWGRLLAPIVALPGNVRGAIYVATAGMIFTIVSAFVKELGGEISVFQVLLIRQATMTVAVLPVIAKDFPDALRTKSLKLQVARVIFAMMAMVGSFLAIQHMPLADATALSFAKSLFVTVFAIIFLKEVAGFSRWAATIVGFGGVLIIVQPGADGIDVSPWLPLPGPLVRQWLRSSSGIFRNSTAQLRSSATRPSWSARRCCRLASISGCRRRLNNGR